MLRVCIVEPQAHPAPGVLERRLPEFGEFAVQTVGAVPDSLGEVDGLVLNNIMSEPALVPEERVLQFVENGGGIFAVHDSVYPYAANRNFIAACGIRGAFDLVQPIQTPQGITYQVLLAKANPDDPMQCFPVRPLPEGIGHPILQGIGEFELSEEVWAQNLATGARPLFSVDVGDRIPSHQRFHQPIPVCACKLLGQGRLAFFSLGHFHAMYENPMFLRLAANALLWVCKQTHETQYAHDLFLSFSSRNKDEARQIYDHATAVGLRVFMDERKIHPGDEWNELIRTALVGSRELALLASPDSLASEWVTTEWGAAWVLERRIVPILLRCDVDALPERLRQYQVIDFHAHKKYLRELRDRGGAWTPASPLTAIRKSRRAKPKPPRRIARKPNK